MFSIIMAVIALGVLVSIHEGGHYLAARKLGVGVEKFSLGFGPKIFSKTIGDTEYILSAIPLGGYVKLVGENADEECETPEISFSHQPVWKRFSIVFAGPLFNMVLAILIYAGAYMVGLPALDSVIDGTVKMTKISSFNDNALVENLIKEKIILKFYEEAKNIYFNFDIKDEADLKESLKEKKIKNSELVLNIWREALKNSPAAMAGLKKGDKILSINSETIYKWNDVLKIISSSPGKKLNIEIQREGETEPLLLKITTKSEDGKNMFGEDVKIGRIGVMPTNKQILEQYGPFQAIGKGMEKSWFIVELVFESIVKLINGSIPANTMGGPIMIGQIAGQQAEMGFMPYIFFIAFLSINLGVFNLLPIPVLDGGHLFFFAIEAISGKPVSENKIMVSQQVGFFTLISLMIFAFYNDIVRNIDWITGFFDGIANKF